MTDKKEVFVTRPIFLKRTFNFRNLLIVLALGFAVLTFFAKKYDYFNFDLSITLFIQTINVVWFDSLMRLITFMGNVGSVGVIFIMIALYGYIIGKKQTVLILAFSTFGGFVLSQILKLLISRPRPDPLLVNQVEHLLKADSFPSGHVLGAVSLYGFLLYIAFAQVKKGMLRKCVLGICILVILLMGLSRIYLGSHWFSDVLGAYLLGFIWLSFVVFGYQKLNPKVNPSKE